MTTPSAPDHTTVPSYNQSTITKDGRNASISQLVEWMEQKLRLPNKARRFVVESICPGPSVQACVDPKCTTQLSSNLTTRVRSLLTPPQMFLTDQQHELILSLGAGIPESDLVLITAASPDHYDELQALLHNLHEFVYPALTDFTMVVWDLGLTTQQRENLEKCCRCHLARFPFEKFPATFRDVRCYMWKPVVHKASLYYLYLACINVLPVSCRHHCITCILQASLYYLILQASLYYLYLEGITVLPVSCRHYCITCILKASLYYLYLEGITASLYRARKYLIWQDASIRYKKGGHEFFSQAEALGLQIMRKDWGEPVAHQTLPEMFAYMGQPHCAFNQFPEIMSGVGVYKNEPFIHRAIVEPWARCGMEKNCMCPRDSHRSHYCPKTATNYGHCHRFDQSALSILTGTLYNKEVYRVVIQNWNKYFSVQRNHVEPNYFNSTGCLSN
ncbi:uncharacterized protein LOC131946334 [Physella acuta]|uniref:uncharacterized protein LOC131946334 n=1 Tax=Physella acuta TaxID=109671 RepID=UPI0027DAE97E|nr:uncharacterized protein LOC131946334 [Physella acuta]